MGESPVSVLASLGLLVVLVCGLLLVVLSSLASRSPNHRGHKPLSLCSALGVRTARFRVCVSAYSGLGDSWTGHEFIAFLRSGVFGEAGCLVC